jgi:hypothetical protein
LIIVIFFLTGTDVLNFKNIFAEKLAGKKWHFLFKILLLLQQLDHTNVFKRKMPFFDENGKNR